MSKTIEYDFQTPKYTNPSGKFIKLDTDTNQIEINDPTIPKMITINTVEISNGTQNINFVNLYEKLEGVTAVVYPPSSSTILTVNDNIVCDNSSGVTTNLTPSNLTIDDTVNGLYATYGTYSISTGQTNGFDIDTAQFNFRAGDVNTYQHGTVITTNDNHFDIDLNAVNITTSNNTYTLPISFTTKNNGSIGYSTAGSWSQVYHFSIPFPAVMVDSNSTYPIWKVDFQMNTTNQTDQDNKELAMYFEIEDANSIIYPGWLFNINTPFVIHTNPSSYTATSSQSQNYGWSDYYDFSGMSGAVPLEFRFYWFASGNNNFDFQLLVHFTRTNLI